MIIEVLESEGYAVESAVSAVSVKKIQQEKKKYQMLILDYNLEDANGITGLDILKMAKELNPDVKGIMVSAFTQQIIRDKKKTKGIFKFLDKPFLVTDLIDSVNEAARGLNNGNKIYHKLHEY
jgi:two-component system response regulator (stage 0 sporulation protein F)